MDPVEIVTAIRIMAGLIGDIAQAVQTLKDGNPDDVDLDGLLRKLDELPDLSTDDEN